MILCFYFFLHAQSEKGRWNCSNNVKVVVADVQIAKTKREKYIRYESCVRNCTDCKKSVQRKNKRVYKFFLHQKN